MTIDENTANGQSNGEYATVIMRICGIEENWTWDETKQRWGTDQFETRKAIEELVELIKSRVVENVNWHREAEKAAGRIARFLEA